MVASAVVIASSSASRVRAWTRRKAVLSLLKACSIGVKSGEVDSNVPMLDCSLIVEQVDAQQFFEASGSADPHGMDRDEDGRACEAEE